MEGNKSEQTHVKIELRLIWRLPAVIALHKRLPTHASNILLILNAKLSSNSQSIQFSRFWTSLHNDSVTYLNSICMYSWTFTKIALYVVAVQDIFQSKKTKFDEF